MLFGLGFIVFDVVFFWIGFLLIMKFWEEEKLLVNEWFIRGGGGWRNWGWGFVWNEENCGLKLLFLGFGFWEFLKCVILSF